MKSDTDYLLIPGNYKTSEDQLGKLQAVNFKKNNREILITLYLCKLLIINTKYLYCRSRYIMIKNIL